MEVKIPENRQVSAFLTLFLFYAVQVGIGILGYERILIKGAGYDSWITVLIAGFVMHIILWLMFRLLERGGGDLITIHKQVFGKLLGGFLSVLASLYFLTMGLVVVRTYTEIVQVWMFPNISYWQVAGIVVIVGYAFISGGFRSVAGISFLSIVYGTPLLFSLFFTLQYAHFDNLLPFFQHSPVAIALTSQKMILNYEGFGTLLFFYPFIKEPKKAKKWAHYAMFLTTILYVVVLLFCIVYFSKDQMTHMLWPTLELWKIVDLPFAERFEYIGITIWLFTILPNLCLTIWAASRGMKRLFNINQRVDVIIMLLFVLIIGYFLDSRVIITKLNTILSDIGFIFLCIYIPFLYILQTIVIKVKKHHAKT